MCAALSPAHYQLRTKILSEAAKHVQSTGFTTAALVAALESLNEQQISDRTRAQLFDRGFPIALVEHIVKTSNVAVQRELDAAFSRDAIIRAVEANVNGFIQNRMALPTESDVAERAVLAKLQLLQPLAQHWPNAVALEYCPANVPFTAINLAEFVDTTAYYMERVSTLKELLEPARRILQSKAMASHIEFSGSSDEASTATSTFLNSFLRGIPLSSGPYAGHSGFNPTWYLKRVQLAGLYCTATTSLLGDVSRNAADTRLMTRKAVDVLF